MFFQDCLYFSKTTLFFYARFLRRGDILKESLNRGRNRMNANLRSGRPDFLALLALSITLPFASAPAQVAPIRVLFLGGGATTPHNPAAMRDVMKPVLEKAGMRVQYHTNESVLHADSLSRYDVMFIYNNKKGSRTDNTPDLTKAQEDALYKWVEAGHGVVAVHSATSSYLENPRFAELLGATYTVHGNALTAITITRPEHGSQTGVSPPTGWDEGRVHRFLKQDLTILATANTEKVPWTWVRLQGKGWVYYTSSGHDDRVWSDLKFQGQLVQAVKWADAASRSPMGIKPAAGRPEMFTGASGTLKDARGREVPGKAPQARTVGFSLPNPR